MALPDLAALLDKFRRRKRRDLDRVQRDLVKGPYERREFAGDPRQARKFWVKTRNRS